MYGVGGPPACSCWLCPAGGLLRLQPGGPVTSAWGALYQQDDTFISMWAASRAFPGRRQARDIKLNLNVPTAGHVQSAQNERWTASCLRAMT